MKSLKPALWILVGVFVGATAFGTPQPVRARQTQPARLKAIPAGNLGSDSSVWVQFLYDDSSAGCWLAVWNTGDRLALAPAPNAACK